LSTECAVEFVEFTEITFVGRVWVITGSQLSFIALSPTLQFQPLPRYSLLYFSRANQWPLYVVLILREYIRRRVSTGWCITQSEVEVCSCVAYGSEIYSYVLDETVLSHIETTEITFLNFTELRL
jgi:hypothetical protein